MELHRTIHKVVSVAHLRTLGGIISVGFCAISLVGDFDFWEWLNPDLAGNLECRSASFPKIIFIAFKNGFL